MTKYPFFILYFRVKTFRVEILRYFYF